MCLWHRTVASCSFLIFLHYITNFTLQIITVSPNYAETVRIKPQTRPFPLSLRPQLSQPLPRFWRSAVPRQKSPALALLNCHNESPGCQSKRIMPHGRLFPGLVTLSGKRCVLVVSSWFFLQVLVPNRQYSCTGNPGRAATAYDYRTCGTCCMTWVSAPALPRCSSTS